MKSLPLPVEPYGCAAPKYRRGEAVNGTRKERTEADCRADRNVASDSGQEGEGSRSEQARFPTMQSAKEGGLRLPPEAASLIARKFCVA
jgi:hypothetical protein